MSQGVVTDYFAKKRRGGYIQPSKRLKLAEDAVKEKIKNEIPIPVQPEKLVHEIRKAQSSSRKLSQHRSARAIRCDSSSKKLELDDCFDHLDSMPESSEHLNLRISPTPSESGCAVGIEVATAATDNHDVPQTPKRRREGGQNKDDQPMGEKRGRVTPKKLGFDFKVVRDEKSGELQPITQFTRSKRKGAGARRKLLHVGNSGNEVKNIETEIPQSEEKSMCETSKKENDKTINVENPMGDDKAISERTNKISTKNAISEVSDKCDAISREKTRSLAETLLATKKESPDTLKETLKNSGNLKELQETLMKIREQKKKQKGNTKKIQKKKEAEKKDVAPTEKREFAYETLHSLSQEVSKGLPLPFKYKILAELFRCADTVVSMLFNRQQVTTWATLQKSVKEMVRKNFELDHLGQIKSVFSSAYLYRQEKGLVSYTEKIRPSNYQLTIEPVLDETDQDSFSEGPRKLTSGMLVRRRHHFLVQLVNIVKEHHKKFLSTLNPPIQVQDYKLRRWHPQFPLDRVPDVEPAELPKPPDHNSERCHSAKEVLDNARSKFTKKAMDALKKVAEKASHTPEKSQPQVIEDNNNLTLKMPATPTKSSSVLKGVSQGLLARIRAKEAEKKMKSMVRSEENRKKLEQLAKLPDVARALRMLYITDKKSALPLEYISEKLVKCCSGILTPASVQEHVLLLKEHLPSWLNHAKVRNADYIRMDKGKEMAEILQHLQRRIKEAEKA